MHLMTHLLMLFAVIALVKWIRAARCSRTPAHFAPEPASGRGRVLHGEVGQLKDRIATLECIAVDGRSSSALAAEIDALRD